VADVGDLVDVVIMVLVLVSVLSVVALIIAILVLAVVATSDGEVEEVIGEVDSVVVITLLPFVDSVVLPAVAGPVSSIGDI
jgi:hypothetical protein